MYLKYIKDGESKIKVQDYEPYLFVESPGNYKTIYGKSLEKKSFRSIDDIKNFVSTTNKKFCGLGLSHRDIIEKDFAYALLADIFPGQMEYDLNKIKILNIDIETSSDNGFPSVDNPIETVLSIACSVTVGPKRTYKIFGLQKSNRPDYIQCGTEETLLHAFFAFVKNISPDIITGWNVHTFDISYLCARTEAKYRKEWLKSLSAFGIQPRKTTVEKFKKKLTVWNIEGTAVLDYLDLYQALTFVERESYKLDHIAYVELGERKLTNKHGNLIHMNKLLSSSDNLTIDINEDVSKLETFERWTLMKDKLRAEKRKRKIND